MKSLRIIGVILIITLLILIFIFSSMNGFDSKNLTKGILAKIMENSQDFNHPFRKIMHAFIYFILGTLIFIVAGLFGMKNKKAMLLAIAISFLYACTDEIHQTFIDERTGQFSDVLIDTFGAFIGINVVIILKLIFLKIRSYFKNID